jgi:phosphatidate cytidylyltransferase
MLKHRLFFGTLMTISFTGIVILDGWLNGSLSGPITDDKSLQSTGCLPAGTILGILIVILIILAQLELSNLAAVKNLRIFTTVSTIASILLATTWYWPQIIKISPPLYLSFVLAFALLGFLLCQYTCYGATAVLANCGVNCFSIIYLGLLSGFVLALRIDFGLWPLLMFIFVVKSSDIGAYAIGSLFGKHKFSPKISPAKTWEGMAGAVITAVIVALVFAVGLDIMVCWLAVIFGFCFAAIAQAGDLAESMMKRDVKQKDSGNKVPTFGGVLDIVDSPLVAAPFAYLFFMLIK